MTHQDLPSQAEDRIDAEYSDTGLSDLDSAASDVLEYETAIARKSLGSDPDALKTVYTSGPRQTNNEAVAGADQEDLDAAEGSLGEEEAETPFELNMFEEIAKELEQASKLPPRGPEHLSGPTRKLPRWVVDSDEDDWAVRDRMASPDRLPINPKTQATAFKFATQQVDAAQVAWESQSLAPITGSVTTPKAKPSSQIRASTQITPRSILRSPRSDATPRVVDPIKTPTSASRLQYVTGSPQTPYTPQRHVFLPLSSNASTLPPMPRVSLNPAAELIAIRAAFTPPPFGSNLSSEGGAEEAESLEDDNLEFILPNTAQSRGRVSETFSDELRIQQDLLLADVLPDDMHSRGDHPLPASNESRSLLGRDLELIKQRDDSVVASQRRSVSGIPVSVDQDLESAGDVSGLVAENGDFSSDRFAPHERAVPSASRHIILSSRPRHKSDAQAFASPNPDEEQEDRQLLHSLETSQFNRHRSSPMSKPSVAYSADQSVHTPDLRFDLPRISGRSIRRAYEMTGQDDFLIDENGTPLEEDSNYVVPRDHVAQRSRIHGQVGEQSSSYSRISGRRKWTKAEEILLYRTVQKVPLTEEYPLRVVWYLHGEYGTLSYELEQFNPQHMKDKMRVIVNTRVNNRRPVVGRARFFLPNHHFDKLGFTEEMKEFKAEQRSKVQRLPPEDSAVAPKSRQVTSKKRTKQKKRLSQATKNRVSSPPSSEEARDDVSNLTVTSSFHVHG